MDSAVVTQEGHSSAVASASAAGVDCAVASASALHGTPLHHCCSVSFQTEAYRLDSAAVAAKRHQYVARNHALMYTEPLHIVRGEGTWLYDNDGNAYLDCANNVAHVGHSNFKVSGRPPPP